jgi:hypothetical protein
MRRGITRKVSSPLKLTSSVLTQDRAGTFASSALFDWELKLRRGPHHRSALSGLTTPIAPCGDLVQRKRSKKTMKENITHLWDIVTGIRSNAEMILDEGTFSRGHLIGPLARNPMCHQGSPSVVRRSRTEDQMLCLASMLLTRSPTTEDQKTETR